MDKWRDVMRRAVACAVVVGVLAACTPGGGAIVTESPSSAGTSTASPTPTASDDVFAALPAEARTNDLEGAVATAEFFVELYGTMLQTGDTRLWDALSGPECGFCNDSSSDVRAHYDAGESVSGGDMHVDVVRSRGRLDDDGYTYVSIFAVQDASTVSSGQTSAEPAGDGGEVGIALRMSWTSDSWRIVEAQVVAPDELEP